MSECVYSYKCVCCEDLLIRSNIPCLTTFYNQYLHTSLAWYWATLTGEKLTVKIFILPASMAPVRGSTLMGGASSPSESAADLSSGPDGGKSHQSHQS